MLKTKPSGSPRPYSRARSLQAHQALTYSAKACGTVSSVDHSQLLHSSSATMQGLFTQAESSSPSMICTVLSSKKREPAT